MREEQSGGQDNWETSREEAKIKPKNRKVIIGVKG